VQKSVFECSVNEAQYEELLRGLLSTIDQKEDNLRLYRLIEPKEKYVDVYGINTAVDFEGPLLV
jgi:CRISPR-associated protein Cas2